MSRLPFTLHLKEGDAVKITRRDGVFLIEPMMFLRTRQEAQMDALSRLSRKTAA